jgi:uncharacterized membrane protein
LAVVGEGGAGGLMSDPSDCSVGLGGFGGPLIFPGFGRFGGLGGVGLISFAVLIGNGAFVGFGALVVGLLGK